jgi:hypothetical protein
MPIWYLIGIEVAVKVLLTADGLSRCGSSLSTAARGQGRHSCLLVFDWSMSASATHAVCEAAE